MDIMTSTAIKIKVSFPITKMKGSKGEGDSPLGVLLFNNRNTSQPNATHKKKLVVKGKY